MKITESKLRQIIREETKRVMSESSKMSLGELIRSLRKAGEDRLADRYQGSLDHGVKDGMLRFRSVGGGNVKMYWSNSMDDSGQGSQYFDDIPSDAARKAGVGGL